MTFTNFFLFFSVKAMMLIIDCKYKLIQKNHPSIKTSVSKTLLVEIPPEDSNTLLDHEETTANGSATQLEEPSKPVVCVSHRIIFFLIFPPYNFDNLTSNPMCDTIYVVCNVSIVLQP